VAGRGEFVPQVVEGIGLTVRGGGQTGACGGNQVLIAAANDRRDGVEVVDLVTQGGNRGECLGDDPAGYAPEQGADDCVRPR